jgi:hypothetical protein
VSVISLPVAQLGAQRPRVHTGPRFSTSAGAEAVDLAAEMGLILDPWQAWVLEQSLGERSDGKWAAAQVCLLCPRQNGKGSILEARELAGLFLFGEKKITHSAHEAKTAKDHFERMESLLRNAGYGDDRVIYRRSTTEVSIFVKETGCKLHLYTRTADGGRGLGGDVVVLDEAFALTRDQMAALMPTMSARSVMGNPQMWFTSSAGFADSDVLAGKKVQGESGSDSRLAYFDWSAAPTAEVTDRSAWAQANPGLGIRISEDFVASELPDLGPERFARERLGIWDEAGGEKVFGPGKWEACAADEPSGTPDCVVVASSVDLSYSCIAAAYAVGGRYHGKPLVYGKGTSWVVAEAKSLSLPVVVDGRGPAAQLVPHLQAAGVRVESLKTDQVLDAHAHMFQLVQDGKFGHASYPELQAAVAGATTRPVGDRWMWARRKSSTDISPLEAVTLGVGFLYRPEQAPEIHEWPDDATLKSWEDGYESDVL